MIIFTLLKWFLIDYMPGNVPDFPVFFFCLTVDLSIHSFNDLKGLYLFVIYIYCIILYLV